MAGRHRAEHPPSESENPMKHMKQLSTLIGASALTLGLGVALLPSVASAAPATTAAPRDLATEKVRCIAAIDVRLVELPRLDNLLASAKNTTDAHKTTQTASNTAAIAGLGSLKTKIAADADLTTLAADCKSIFEDYRVFALRAPQTHLVIAGDAEVFAVTKLNDVVPKLSDAIDKAAAAGKDMTGAKTALADLQAKLADAGTKANGLADSVIGYVPADYNANHALLDGPHSSVRAAAADLKGARADIKTIVAAVKA
jgi:hypothetical protein